MWLVSDNILHVHLPLTLLMYTLIVLHEKNAIVNISHTLNANLPAFCLLELGIVALGD